MPAAVAIFILQLHKEKIMQIRIRSTGQVLFQHEWEKWVAVTYAKSLSGLTPEVVNSFDSDVVLEGPQASPTRYQVAFRDGVEQVDGNWYTKYSVADMDAEQIAAADAAQAKSVRQTRDDLLKETDWLVIRSVETNTALTNEWATYRQALRDLPSQAGFPWEVQWPTKPE